MPNLILPWPAKGLSLNDRVHWSVRARVFKASKQLAWREAVKAKLVVPSGAVTHVWITAYAPTRNFPDRDNIQTRCKAYLDGIALALGVNDSTFYPHTDISKTPVKGGAIHIRLTGTE